MAWWALSGFSTPARGAKGAVAHLRAPQYSFACPLQIFGPWYLMPMFRALYWQGLGMRLRGKSFRWRRGRGGLLLLRLGYSHAVVGRLIPGTRFGRFRKTSMHVWGTHGATLSRVARSLVALRVPNIYHGRGIRLTKHALLRKHGKVSAYR